MKYICPVCHKEFSKNVTKCELCGFVDKLGIDRTWPIAKDAENWLNTVIKPYRKKWQKQIKEMQTSISTSKKKVVLSNGNKDKYNCEIRKQNKERQRKYRESHRQEINEQLIERYNAHIASDNCPRCGVKPAEYSPAVLPNLELQEPVPPKEDDEDQEAKPRRPLIIFPK